MIILVLVIPVFTYINMLSLKIIFSIYCKMAFQLYVCFTVPKLTLQSFATHSHFKYHMSVHRNERTYSCDVCGDSFFQKSKLQRHKLKHSSKAFCFFMSAKSVIHPFLRCDQSHVTDLPLDFGLCCVPI